MPTARIEFLVADEDDFKALKDANELPNEEWTFLDQFFIDKESQDQCYECGKCLDAPGCCSQECYEAQYGKNGGA